LAAVATGGLPAGFGGTAAEGTGLAVEGDFAIAGLAGAGWAVADLTEMGLSDAGCAAADGADAALPAVGFTGAGLAAAASATAGFVAAGLWVAGLTAAAEDATTGFGTDGCAIVDFAAAVSGAWVCGTGAFGGWVFGSGALDTGMFGIITFVAGGFGATGFAAALAAPGFATAGRAAGLAAAGAAVRRCGATCLAFAAGREGAAAAPEAGRFFFEPLARAGAFMPDNSPAALPEHVVGTASCAPTRFGQTNLSAKDAPGSLVPPLRRHWCRRRQTASLSQPCHRIESIALFFGRVTLARRPPSQRGCYRRIRYRFRFRVCQVPG
jgi:hypothetical protein